jgi:flagellar hook-basal body complex protein FliE
MPYTIRKQKCKKSDGGSGSYVLSYTDKNGKKHSACHNSKKKAKGQIAAIEMESFVRLAIGSIIQEEIRSTKEKETMKIRLSQLKQIIREAIKETMEVEEADKDLNKDGEHDFEDVMIARMKASGMDKEDAVEKGEKAAKVAKKQ